MWPYILLGVFFAMSMLTSPLAFVELLLIIAEAPLLMLRSVVGYFAPWLFYKDLSGDTVLITGAASGLGRLMSIEFASLGVTNVVMLDLNAEGLESAADDVRAAAAEGTAVHTFTADLSSRDETTRAMESVLRKVGKVTILINNAGIVTGKKFLDCPDRLMELTMRVNAESHFWTTKAVLPTMMDDNHGHIVTVASSAGFCGVPGLADYCASKHAAFGFDESIRLEARKMGKTGVKTTVVCPFFIKTGMFEGAKTKWPLLIPILEPDYAVSKIVRAVRCNQEVLIMPLIVHLTPMMRGLFPVVTFDKLAEWFGVLDTMDDFAGRGSAAPNAAPPLVNTDTDLRKLKLSEAKKMLVEKYGYDMAYLDSIGRWEVVNLVKLESTEEAKELGVEHRFARGQRSSAKTDH